jgi:RNA polymerase sigma factor (sigma-70 family)
MWRPWLFGIARNRALEHFRFLKRGGSDPEFEESHVREYVADVSVEVEIGEDAEAIRQLVASLPDGQREAVELRFWAGLSYREISEVLGGSEGALRVQLHRTLRGLRDRLDGSE